MPGKFLGFALTALLAQQEPSATVEKGTLVIQLELEGSFEPVVIHDVKLKLEALNVELEVAEAPVSHGQAVKKGDLLIKLQAPRAADVLAAAEAEAASAKAALAKAEEDWKRYEPSSTLALQRARREKELADERLRLFKEVEEPMAKAQSDHGLRRTQDYIDDQRDELAQLEKMYKSEELTNATADIVLLRARRQLERSLADMEFAKIRAKKLREVELPNQLDQLTRDAAQKALDWDDAQKSAPQNRILKQAELTKARLNAKRLEEQLGKLKSDVELLAVRAPADGAAFFGRFVKGRWEGCDDTIRALRTGEKVSAAQIQMTVVGDKLGFRTEVGEADYGKIQSGMSVAVSVVAFPEAKLDGSTVSLSPTGPFELKIKLSETPKRLIAGMKGKATILLERLENVLLAPSVFILEEQGKKICYLKSGPKEVTIGKTNGKQTQILSGLAPGDVLVLPKK